ncbi:MAG: type I-D CRISPR-associated protein Cas7/Csc2 [bacterium]|nr:type I-D CRISPR-associated protein Cas7/Csc2 [bacterium]
MLKFVSKDVFVDAIPQRPMGKYAHIVLIRETQSFPLFQTDGGLNTVRVSAGLEHPESMARVMLFKRKQSSPERLTGRELLRRYKLVDEKCDYNVEFCMKCPDCIYYGFAIGDSGSEKSKVFVDTAYSITGYDESHQQLSFNALYEEGKMSRKGETRSSFGEQDHVLPQVFFPNVLTIKDPTENEFIYVLNNILRTKRYGAQESRTGKVENHVVGVVFADGEIFSNLKFTQALYDVLLAAKEQLTMPLNAVDVLTSAYAAIPKLLQDDGVVYTLKQETELENLLDEITSITTDEAKLQVVLAQAAKETEAYYSAYIAKKKKK